MTILARLIEQTTRPSQPKPRRTTETPIHDIVVDDLIDRKQLGIDTYGTPLQPGNGRDHMWDTYEELLDAACYIRAEIERRNNAGR